MDEKRVPNIRPASKGTDDSYEPQGSGMDHGPAFRAFAPGSANSGNMKYPRGAPGDHSIATDPPKGLKSE
jgi:hypothetical protein